jgi:putative ABC transport system permease protein
VPLLGRDFTRLVTLALLVAGPVAYLLTTTWLTYAYRIDVPLGLFLAAGFAVLLVAWATMSVQVLRVVAARSGREPAQRLGAGTARPWKGLRCAC